MPTGANEAVSRALIEAAQVFSGWGVLHPQEVRFELSMDDGRADYVEGGKPSAAA